MLVPLRRAARRRGPPRRGEPHRRTVRVRSTSAPPRRRALAGYGVQQALATLGRARGGEVPVAVVLTRVEVAADDPAFARPTPRRRAALLGRHGAAARARPRLDLRRERGLAPARGPGAAAPAYSRGRRDPPLRGRGQRSRSRRPAAASLWSRPPRAIAASRRCSRRRRPPRLLATALAADRLVFLTGVDRVEVGHRTARAIGVEHLSLAEARALLAAREFPAASYRAQGPGGGRLRRGGRPRGDHHLALGAARRAGRPRRHAGRALTDRPAPVTASPPP